LWISGTYTAALPRALYFLLSFLSAVAGLTGYRILMVWVHDRTASLLVVTLMHASLTASNIFIFRPLTTGLPFLIYGWLFSALLWIVVAMVVLANHGELARLRLRPRAV
jgi:hypothetical protein